MRKIVFSLLLAVSLHYLAMGDVNKTYTTTPNIEWYPCSNGGYITQSFAVAPGQLLTKVEFYVDDSGTGSASYEASFALYSGYYGDADIVQMVNVSSLAINSGEWLQMDLAPAQLPGRYYMRVWSDDPTYNSLLKGLLYSDSYYYGGCAAEDAAGTTLLDENQDFRARFTTEAIPPVTPRYPLRNGDFSFYDYGGGAVDWETVVELGQYNFELEPDRSYLYNDSESAMTISAATAGVAYCTQSVNLPPGEYTLTVDVDAPSSAVARIAAGSGYQDVTGTTDWQTVDIDFTASGPTSIYLYSLGPDTVKFRRASVVIRSLSSSVVPLVGGGEIGNIVVAADAPESDKYAAYELQRCIYEMTAALPGLEGRDVTYTGKSIVIGQANDPCVLAELNGLKDDSYLVRVDAAGDIVLAGNTSRGTLYAVYDFLKMQGCAWHLPNEVGEVMPQRSEILLPDPNRLEIPDWETRGIRQNAYQCDIDGTVGNLNPEDYFDWSVRNRLNAFCNGEYRFSHDFGEHRGGSHQQGTDHTWKFFLLDSHPEWWVLIDGERVKNHTSGRPNQLCVSNQQLRDWVVQYILNYFEAYPERTIFSLSAEDEPCYWCECSNCRALDPDGGTGPWVKEDNGVPALDMADRSIDFVNEVASRVAAVYPDRLIQTYAYASTRNPPTTQSVHPNVLVKFCWAGAPVDRPILEMTHEKNILTQTQILGWQTAGTQHFGLYDYGNYFHNDSPNFHYFHGNDYFHTFNQDWGFEHLFGESDNHMPQSHMFYNLMALSLWDTDTDYIAAIGDICDQFYGAAADSMTSYYMFMQSHPLNSDIWQEDDGYVQSLNLADFPVDVLEQGRMYLEQAVVAAEGDPVIDQRLAYARFGHAVMTYERGMMVQPVRIENRHALGRAFVLARQLSQQYDILLYPRFSDLFEQWDYVPLTYTWDRSNEWTAELNPDNDEMGNYIWRYQYADRGNALGETSPWYTQSCYDMEWNGSYWKYSADTAPCVYPETLRCELAKVNNPIVRWTNETMDIFDANVTGDLTVEWAANCDVSDVDIVIAFKDISADTWTELLAQTVSKPSGVVSYSQSVVVPVNLTTPEIGSHDEIVVSVRPHAATGAGQILLYDNLGITVTNVASQLPAQTYTGGDTGRWYGCNTNYCITQSFTVPDGHTLTAVDFFLNDGTHDGKTYVDPAAGYEVTLALKAGNYGSGTLVQLITIPQEETDYVSWIKMALEAPQPSGNYYIQVWSDQSAYNVRLHGWLVSDSEYTGGRAATGWNGTSLLAADEDFKANFYTRTNCGAEGTIALAADITGPTGTPDCYVDQLDLGLMAGQWMQCHQAQTEVAIVNGGFEAGDPYPWSNGDFTGWINVNAKNCICLDGGTEGGKYMFTDAINGTAQFQQYTSHVIQSGYTYTLSCDAFSSGANQFILAICVIDGGGSVVAQSAGQGWDTGTTPAYEEGTSWQSYSVSFNDDGTYAGNTLMVYFAVLGNKPSGSYGSIDNVSVTERSGGSSGSCVEFLESDIAGPDGVGWDYRDFYVGLLDFAVIASQWLTCSDPANLYDCPAGQ